MKKNKLSLLSNSELNKKIEVLICQIFEAKQMHKKRSNLVKELKFARTEQLRRKSIQDKPEITESHYDGPDPYSEICPTFARR